MSNQGHNSWLDANQHYLMAELAVVRVRLALCSARAHSGDERGLSAELNAAVDTAKQARSALETPAPLDVVCKVFGLSSFERDLLLLCAGSELDKSISLACEEIQGVGQPTFALALMALPGAYWGTLAADASLRCWRLIDMGQGDTFATRRLRIDDYILHFLLGLPSIDERLFDVFEPVTEHLPITPSQEEVVRRIISIWADDMSVVVSLCSSVPSAMHAVAVRACARIGLGLCSVSSKDLPENAVDRAIAARLWQRHAALNGSALLIQAESEPARDKAAVFAESLRSPVLVAAADPVRLRHRAVARVDVAKPLPGEQRALWAGSLGVDATRFEDGLELVASHFHLSVVDIAAVSAQARSQLDAESSEGHAQLLWNACRAQARPKFESLAQHIEPRATWDDLILPVHQWSRLREIGTHVRHRAQVYNAWGFAERSARGLGISALFSGPSGTGKTTAAEILARELNLDLYRIDLSSVVSKYIGETEKNLRQVFDAAEDGGVVLLFDEADALFGKRSEVKDSHDRYANMEVSYLLQRMEAYRGLAILTTNLRDSLDSAFLRRIRFVVEFPFPSQEDRAAIWARMFPPGAPIKDLVMHKLARLNLSGGSIRNVVVSAAFLAAEQGEPIQMKHLQQSARTELAKIDRPLLERDLKDWI